ncbi:unnamed protein product [Meloidogyne enterolobii]|uniref:Uncharacterized protein n=1 Tax=Meloidogyne enterolobii TaxID=390850 RepID=A0ACB1ATG5_MELEN
MSFNPIFFAFSLLIIDTWAPVSNKHKVFIPLILAIILEFLSHWVFFTTQISILFCLFLSPLPILFREGHRLESGMLFSTNSFSFDLLLFSFSLERFILLFFLL